MLGNDEEFEFKPLTEGLGFHKKTIEIQDDTKAQMKATPTHTGILPTAKFWGRSPSATTTAAPTPSPTPAAPVRPTTPRQSPASQIHPQSEPALGWKPQLADLDFAEEMTKSSQYQPALTSFTAAFFDGAMVIGMSLIFSAAVFAITGVDFSTLWEAINNTIGGFGAIAILIFAVFEIYAIGCRSFFGRTLAEWAFGYRMGTPEQQVLFSYPIRVAIRVGLHFITGFILIPAISSALGFDVAGRLTGVSVYQEKS